MAFEKFTGKTLEEALDQAAQAKNVMVDELHYTVTEEKSGFLGLGKHAAINAASLRVNCFAGLWK